MSDFDLIKTVHVFKSCPFCGVPRSIKVNVDDYDRWQNGELIQNVWPHFTPTQRELLITGICDPCWDDKC